MGGRGGRKGVPGVTNVLNHSFENATLLDRLPGGTNVLNHSFENATLLDRLPYCYVQITWRFQHKERNFVSQS